jgi:ABC-2 type transport system ATP-binding protein
MIEVKNLVQHYGVRPVLKDVSFSVNRGELMAVMGPNGMGKSTLLSTMAGLLTPRKGQVVIDGKRRRNSEEEELAIRKITYFLPTDPWLPQQLTGREFLLAVGEVYDVETERLFEHIDRALILFNLCELENATIASYSTGQKKKIALSAALISEAKVMILDEPFSGGLDPSGLLAARKVLKSLAEREDVTICMATPVPEFVEELAHRVVVLKDGEVLACESIPDLRKRAQCEGSMTEVMEQLISPQTLENVAYYFERNRT